MFGSPLACRAVDIWMWESPPDSLPSCRYSDVGKASKHTNYRNPCCESFIPRLHLVTFLEVLRPESPVLSLHCCPVNLCPSPVTQIRHLRVTPCHPISQYCFAPEGKKKKALQLELVSQARKPSSSRGLQAPSILELHSGFRASLGNSPCLKIVKRRLKM